MRGSPLCAGAQVSRRSNPKKRNGVIMENRLAEARFSRLL